MLSGFLHRSRLWLLFALTCIAAQVALVGSGVWHRHDDLAAGHDDCATCVAAAADRTDGLPPVVCVAALVQLPGLIEVVAETDSSVRILRDTRVRGPPAI